MGKIKAVFDLQERATIRTKAIEAVYADSEVPLIMERLDSSATVYNLFSFLACKTKEYFFALHLSAKNEVICLDVVSVGSLNASIVHPREVYKSALLSSAGAIIFIHNHPSGNPEPSREDIELTQRLKEAGELLGIRVLDHIIIGKGNYISFADRGLI